MEPRYSTSPHPVDVPLSVIEEARRYSRAIVPGALPRIGPMGSVPGDHVLVRWEGGEAVPVAICDPSEPASWDFEHPEPDRWVRASQLAGTEEIAQTFGVLRYTVWWWAGHYPDFPEPVLTIGKTRAWLLPDVVEWRSKHWERKAS